MNQTYVKELMFKVTYREMEGDNYAGGLVTKQAYINELGDCDRFDKIIKVEAIMIKNYGEVDEDQIKAAILAKNMIEKSESNKERIKKLKKELKELEKSEKSYKPSPAWLPPGDKGYCAGD